MARRTTESHTEDNRRRVGLINCSNWNNLPLQRLKGVDLLYQTHLAGFFFFLRNGGDAGGVGAERWEEGKVR